MPSMQRKSHTSTRARATVAGLLLASCCLAVSSDAAASSSSSSLDSPFQHEQQSLPSCPVTGRGLDVMHERYHSDSVCDRAEFNRFKASFDRIAKAEALSVQNRHAMVPNEHTVHCPAHVSTLYPPPHQEFVTGFDRSWVVKNAASTPVVVLWVDPADHVEKSAFSDAIPPTSDPEAVLSPGEWTVVSGHDGHVFHVREILPDMTMGRILLQHRLGWIPVGGKLSDNARQLVCPDVDERPVLSSFEDDYDESESADASSQEYAEQAVTYDPAYERTPRSDDRHCNRQDVGFRNMLGCPVHGYYVEEDTCDELFKMHLGVDSHRGIQDFMDDWASQTKFEASYFGHTFVFRSAHTGAEVDRITLLPTSVTDCPDLTQTVAQRTASDAEILAVVRLEGDAVPLNLTSTGETGTTTLMAQLPNSFIKTRGSQR